MKSHIEMRVKEVAEYIINSESTVRATSKKFNVSKSTIYKDVTERLLQIDSTLAKDVKRVLTNNKAVRHMRGGRKYERNVFAQKTG